MKDKNRAALEAACARAIESMTRDDGFDGGYVTVGAGDYVVRILTTEAHASNLRQMQRYRDGLEHAERARQDTERLLSETIAERDAAIAARDESHADAMEKNDLAIAATRRADAAERARDEVAAKLEATDENLGTAIDALRGAERARDELGIQLAAAQAEISRLRPVVDAVRRFVAHETTRPYTEMHDALARLDTVPGDALRRP